MVSMTRHDPHSHTIEKALFRYCVGLCRCVIKFVQSRDSVSIQTIVP